MAEPDADEARVAAEQTSEGTGEISYSRQAMDARRDPALFQQLTVAALEELVEQTKRQTQAIGALLLALRGEKSPEKTTPVPAPAKGKDADPPPKS